MEFLDSDLKRYMDKVGDGDGMGPDIVKVRAAPSRSLLSRPEGADSLPSPHGRSRTE